MVKMFPSSSMIFPMMLTSRSQLRLFSTRELSLMVVCGLVFGLRLNSRYLLESVMSILKTTNSVGICAPTSCCVLLLGDSRHNPSSCSFLYTPAWRIFDRSSTIFFWEEELFEV